MWTRREFGASLAAMAQAAGARPNVVVLLADDMGWRDAGFHGGKVPTPNIDRIAREGAELTRCYAFPFCSPTRSALLTGRMPIRYGMVYTVIRPWSPHGLPVEEHLLSETMRGMGYQTACIGKWHLGHAHRRLLPNARGFDHFYGHVNADIDYNSHKHMGGLDWQRNGVSVEEDGYSTTLLGNEAVRWIERRDRSKPFFLYLPFNAIHTPLTAPDEVMYKYRQLPHPRLRVLAGALDVMDTAVGQVLSVLEREGIARDTLVLFLSDNGGAPGQGSDNGPLRAGKGTTYEGGIRVPAAVRFPGRIPAGGRVDQVMTVMDVFPTLVAAAGGKPQGKKPLDGMNVWPQWTGAAAVAREPLFFAVKSNERADYRYAVLHGDWKLIRTVEQGKAGAAEYLFQLSADPAEAKDVREANAGKAKELSEALDQWLTLHPDGDILSSVRPHPGWIPPKDYAAAARQD
jgi:arylsulfatase A-like enzyme